ncbi:unnamed protein product, partial [Clonostachys byssicola]
ACDSCRKKKIRCEPIAEGCIQCIKYHIPCHFTPISTKRCRRKPSGYRQIRELEERLKHMEIQLSKALETKGIEGGDSSHKGGIPFGVIDLKTCENVQSHRDIWSTAGTSGPAGATLMNCSPSENPERSIIGTIVPTDEHLLIPLHSAPSFTRAVPPGPFKQLSLQPMPPKSLALELVQDTMISFNRFIPLFDEQDFLQQFEEQYPSSNHSNTAWWACINVVLSLSHRFRAMRTLEPACENTAAYGHLRNAMSVVAELNMLQNSLPAIQALVGMALIFEGTPDPHPSSVLIASAVRLAQSMRLHRRCGDRGLTPLESEQRRRVFWIAYFLDRDISLRTRQPFTQDDDDMDVELPSENPTNELKSSDELCTVNFFFKSRIGLAVIQGQIYRGLYSVQASRQSEAHRVKVAQELSQVLVYWRSTVPVGFEDHFAIPLQPPLSPKMTHLLIIRFTYVHCLTMIDPFLQPTGCSFTEAASQDLDDSMITDSLCISECRKAVSLISMTPCGDYACVWMLLCALFSVVRLLFENILRFPTSPHAETDYHALQPSLKLFSILANKNGKHACSRETLNMHNVCQDLNDQAKQLGFHV